MPKGCSIETATNKVDSLGGQRSVAIAYDGRVRVRPSLMQIKTFNFRSNKAMMLLQTYELLFVYNMFISYHFFCVVLR